MSVKRMHHVGVVVDDLEAATAFFTELGLETEDRASADDERVGRIIGLEDVRTEFVMMRTPGGDNRIELVKFLAPTDGGAPADAPSHVPGLRHLAFEVEDLDDVVSRLQARGGALVGEIISYGGTYRLCYFRGPAGVILELAEAAG